MAKNLTDEQLASRLERNQVDRTDLDEAARRIRGRDLDQLITVNSIVEALHATPLLDENKTEIAEKVIAAVTAQPRRQSSSKMSTLASKVWRTGEATREEVRSLAACVMSQDETPGQS